MKKSKLQVLVLAMITAGCVSLANAADKAAAELTATEGNTVKGAVTFNQKGDKVAVVADVSGLPANSEHGFHVHEKGDCSAPDATSAGGHFNPGNKPHGHGSAERHVGDMPNLKSDANGVAKVSFELDLLSLKEDSPNNIIGRAVIVHKNPDDYTSQPVGNAGARIACGVIKAQ
ncbi:MAG: superoxide dismutase family protein [Burkholderiales bacterium]|nr:superoxide dismutase family protein [Burkholderiales bacterium]